MTVWGSGGMEEAGSISKKARVKDMYLVEVACDGEVACSGGDGETRVITDECKSGINVGAQIVLMELVHG